MTFFVAQDPKMSAFDANFNIENTNKPNSQQGEWMILNAKDYENTYLALHACIMARVPVILWGPPGQGKTSVIKAMAEHDQRMIRVLLASIREPQDFGGLPSIQDGRATLIAPDWAQDLAADTNGILFMDEVNTAPPAVQAALLRVSLDKVAGDCYLGDGTSVVAAANPPEIAADVCCCECGRCHSLPSPRLCFLCLQL